MAEQELICINCPLGCPLRAQVERGEVLWVTGNGCPRGEAYARQECLEPRRVVAGTVRVQNGAAPLAPARTSAPVPKGRVMAVAAAMRALEVAAPVALGQTLLCNVAGAGADLVATKAVGTQEGRSRL